MLKVERNSPGFSVNLCMGMGYNILFVSEVIKGAPGASKTGIRFSLIKSMPLTA